MQGMDLIWILIYDTPRQLEIWKMDILLYSLLLIIKCDNGITVMIFF